MTYILPYIAMVVTIALLDLVWLGVVMKDFYRAHLGHLMGTTVVWPAAIIFYLMFAAGVMYFAVLPAVASGSLWRAVMLGALLGVFAYATYDLTNQATLKDWPVTVTIVDILWGGVITAIAATVGFFVSRMG